MTFIPKLLAAALAIFILAGCGGTTHKTPAPSQIAASRCLIGQSYMGCASGAQRKGTFTLPLGKVGAARPVPGCKFPDVSDWQGHPNWAAAAPYICAGVAKAGEGFSQDPDFTYSVGQLRALHIPWSAYWFVRSCSEGSTYVSVLNSVGFRGDRDALRPVLDMEVGSAYNCAVPIANSIHAAFGVWPIIYTAPGTWPGGSSGGLDVWEADYSSLLAPLPFSARVLAWQAWSPPYRYLYIPGLGYGDVSVDLHGFSTAFAYPVAPGPTKTQIAAWERGRDSSLRAYRARHCTKPAFGSAACYAYGQRVIAFQVKLPKPWPKCWGRHEQLSAAVCVIVRPLVYVRGQASAATYSAARRHGCYGPSGQTPVRSRACDSLFSKARYFGMKAHSTFEAWS